MDKSGPGKHKPTGRTDPELSVLGATEDFLFFLLTPY